MDGNPILDLLESGLQAHLEDEHPDLLVTRNGKDFAQYSLEQRQAGVITLISQGITNLRAQRAVADVAGNLGIYLMAEFELAESAIPYDVERAEWALWAEVYEFLASPGAGLCPLDVISMRLSAQASCPTGWFFAVLDYSELDAEDQ